MPTLYERYNKVYNSSMGVYDVQWRAMTFTVGTVSNNTSFYISKVRLFCYKEGAITGNVTLSIYATAAGLPTGAALATATVLGTAVLTTNSWVEWVFGTTLLLSPGTKYAIVVSCVPGDASNKFIWKQNSSTPYAGGGRCDSVDGGVNWTGGGTSIGEMFEIYGCTRSLMHGKAKTAMATNTVAYYNRPMGGSTWVVAASKAQRYSVSPSTGVLRNLRVQIDTAPGAGKIWTFTLQKNGTNTTLSVAITGASTFQGVDITNSVSVAQNDTFLLEANPMGVPAISTVISWCIEFEGRTINRSQLYGACESGLTPASTNYWNALGSDEDKWSSVSKYMIMPCNGNLMDLVVQGSQAVAATYQCTFTVEKNGVDTTLTLIIAAGASAGNVQSSIAFVAGDKFNIRMNQTDTATIIWCWSCSVAHSNEGDFICTHNYGIISAATLYQAFALSYDAWTASETGLPGITSAMGILNIYGVVEAAPGTGNTQILTLRKNGSDTTMTITFGATDLVKSDTTHYQSIADYDTLSLKYTYTGTPPGNHPCFSLRCRMSQAYEVYAQDIMGLIDTVAATVTHAGQQYLATDNEKIGVKETIAANAKFQPVINEKIGEIDTVTKVYTGTATINEKIGLMDISVASIKIQTIINEMLGLREIIPLFPYTFPINFQLSTTLQGGKQAIVNETIGIKETVAVTAWFQPVITEQIGVKDTIVSYAAKFRTVNETLGLMESIATSMRRISTTSELLGLIDAVTTTLAAGKSVTVSEIIGLLDAKTLNLKAMRTVNETIGLIDVTVMSTKILKTFYETIGLVEYVQTTKISTNQYTVNVNEVIGLKDTVLTTDAFMRNIIEAIGLIETVVNYTKWFRTAPEIIGVKETVVTYSTFQRAITELLGLKENIVVNTKFMPTVNEKIGLLDQYSFRIPLTINEKMGLLDSATAIKNFIAVQVAYYFDINVYY